MKKYLVYSAKNQGSYKKGDFLYSLTESRFKAEYGSLDFNQVTSDGTSRIFIKEVA